MIPNDFQTGSVSPERLGNAPDAWQLYHTTRIKRWLARHFVAGMWVVIVLLAVHSFVGCSSINFDVNRARIDNAVWLSDSVLHYSVTAVDTLSAFTVGPVTGQIPIAHLHLPFNLDLSDVTLRTHIYKGNGSLCIDVTLADTVHNFTIGPFEHCFPLKAASSADTTVITMEYPPPTPAPVASIVSSMIVTSMHTP